VRIRVGGVLVRDDSVLLLKYEYSHIPLWQVPGGNLQEGETLADAIVREFKEELAIDVNVRKLFLLCESTIPADRPPTLHCVFYIEHLGEPTIVGSDSKATECKWVRYDKLRDMFLYPNISEYLLKSFQLAGSEWVAGYVGVSNPVRWL
jgi:ADP-ribose pyrophosphatase YjhB (NUDIX family)